jgi:hypothetical protein
MSVKTEQNWSMVIRSKTNLFDWNLKELWKYKDLIYMFIIRDFSSVYKQTILGPLWYIIQPLLTTVIYALVFGGLTQMSTEGQPKMLFYMSGIIFWNYFSNNLIKNSETFLINSGLFGKVYFPRLTVPIATTYIRIIGPGFSGFIIGHGVCVFFCQRGSVNNPALSIIISIPVVIDLFVEYEPGYHRIIPDHQIQGSKTFGFFWYAISHVGDSGPLPFVWRDQSKTGSDNKIKSLVIYPGDIPAFYHGQWFNSLDILIIFYPIYLTHPDPRHYFI